GLDEGVVRDGGGLGLVADDGVGDAEDLPLEALDEDGEGAAVAPEGAGDELLVGRRFVELAHANGHYISHAAWTALRRKRLRDSSGPAGQPDPGKDEDARVDGQRPDLLAAVRRRQDV